MHGILQSSPLRRVPQARPHEYPSRQPMTWLHRPGRASDPPVQMASQRRCQCGARHALLRQALVGSPPIIRAKSVRVQRGRAVPQLPGPDRATPSGATIRNRHTDCDDRLPELDSNLSLLLTRSAPMGRDVTSVLSDAQDFRAAFNMIGDVNLLGKGRAQFHARVTHVALQNLRLWAIEENL